LKDDGVAMFVDEATFFNPLIKFAYETLFGKGRTGRRRKFLFFTRRGDEFEKPIEEADLKYYEGQFLIESVPCKFLLIEKIAHVISAKPEIHALFGRVDSFLLYLFPQIKRYSYEHSFIYRKK